MYKNVFSKLGRSLVVIGCSALLLSCERLITPDFETEMAELRSGAYTLDQDHASLIFKVNHLGFSTYIGRFNEFDATLDFDPENVENSSLEVIVDMTSLDVDNPEFAEELRGDS